MAQAPSFPGLIQPSHKASVFAEATPRQDGVTGRGIQGFVFNTTGCQIKSGTTNRYNKYLDVDFDIMKKSSKDNWEEIVFENRNRAYGAYLLRHNYPVYLTVSALSVIFLFLIIVIGLNIKREKKGPAYNMKYVQITDYTELSAPPPVKKKQAPKKKAVVKPPEVKKYIPPVVTPEKIIEPEEIVTVEEIKEITPIEEPVEEAETDSEGVEDGPPAPFFDVNPSFRGGGITFEDWLARNLKYPIPAKRMGIEGTVIVEFTVDEYGNVSDPTILESLHRLCDREAMRLVRIMPPWAPGIRNGRRTGGRHVVEIPFILR